MTVLDAAADRVKPIVTTLTQSPWIPQLLVRLFVGYFFFETGWSNSTNAPSSASSAR